MVKIRLRRTGAKKQPSYRVVVADERSPRDGKFIEIIGHYNPRTEPSTVEINAERALYWLSVGAQPSEAVRRMLDRMGLMAQVPAVRKGELSIDEIVAQFLQEKETATVTKAVAAKAVAEVVAEEEEEEAVAEEEEEEEEAVAEEEFAYEYGEDDDEFDEDEYDEDDDDDDEYDEDDDDDDEYDEDDEDDDDDDEYDDEYDDDDDDD
jgi:small subunit ribosomal protein S16